MNPETSETGEWEEADNRLGFTAGWRASIASVLCVTLLTPSVLAGVLTPAQTKLVNDGQSDAMSELNRLNTTGRPVVTNSGNSTQTSINISELVPGSSMDTSSLEAPWNDPKSTQDITKKSRAFIQMNGCRKTGFTYIGKKVIATYQAVHGRGSEATPIPYSGSITPFAALGAERSTELPINSAANTWLKVHLTPFPFPTDHTYVVGNFDVVDVTGSGTLTVDSYSGTGVAGEGFIPRVKGLVASNAGQVQITAEAWKVDRAYTAKPPSGVCQPDPQVGVCNFNGYDVCSTHNQEEVKLLFAPDAAPSLNAVTDSYDSVRKSLTKARPTNSDALQMVNASRNVFNGTAGDVVSLFQGCQVDTRYSSSVNTIQLKDPRTCSNYRIGSEACSADKRFQLVQIQSLARVATITQYEGSEPVNVTEPLSFDFPLMATPSTRDQDLGPVMINVKNPVTQLMESRPKGHWVDEGVDGWKYVETGERITRHIDLTPFVLKPNDYVIGALTVVNANMSLTSVGAPSNSWTPTATIQPDGNSPVVYVTADVYQVVINEVKGCEDQRHLAPAPGETRPFCKMNTTCTGPTNDCVTSNGLTFCASTGALRGIFEIYPKWGDVWDEGVKGQCSSIKIDANPTCSAQDVTDSTKWGSNIGDSFNSGFPWKDNCASQGLFGNNQCRLVNFGQCNPTAKGKDGTCYGYTVTYDCGRKIDVISDTASPGEATCATAIRCMGDECRNVKTELNSSFTKAAAAGQVVEMMQHDFKCLETGDKPKEGAGCTPEIFGGVASSCRTAIIAGAGIVPDCCKQAQEIAAGTDFAGWLTVATQTYKLANTPMVAEALANMGVDSAWMQAGQSPVSMVTQPVMSGLASLGRDFGWDGLTKFAEDALKDEVTKDATSTGVSAFQQTLMNYTRDFLANNFPELANAIFGETANQTGNAALSEGASQAANMLSSLMSAYSIYSIIRLIGHLLYKCSDEENQLGVGLGTKSCTYIGEYCSVPRKKWEVGGVSCHEIKKSYCCYTSPLARIIMEQARAQLGGYGDIKAPNCAGLTPSELATLNWNQIDLSEWVGMLQEQGLLPKGATDAQAMYGMNSNWAVVKGITDGASIGPSGLKSPAQLTQEKLGDKAGVIDNVRSSLAGQRVCFDRRNPARGQWYEPLAVSPQDIIRPIGGTGTVMNCTATNPDDGCIEIYLGVVGNNYLDGNDCAVPFDKYFSMYVKRPDLIKSAQIVEGQWDDHLRVEIAGVEAFASNGYTAAGAGACELGTHWCLGVDADIANVSGEACGGSRYGTVDVTGLYKVGGEINTKTSVKVGGKGEGFARIRILYDRAQKPLDPSVDCYAPGS